MCWTSFVAISLDAVHKILRLKRHSRDHFYREKNENNCDEWDTSDAIIVLKTVLTIIFQKKRK